MDGWRAWYTNGRTFNSDDDAWSDLPHDGVLVIVVYLDEYSGADDGVQHRYILDGSDWYFHVPDEGIIGSNSDSASEILERYPGALLKRGKWTDPETFRAVKQAAVESEAP